MKHFLLIPLLAITFNSFTQVPNYEWVKKAGGSNNDAALSVTTDASGNVIIGGYFNSPTIVFGSYTLTNTSINKSDMFLVKYDSLGNVIWAKCFGGNDNDQATAITSDDNGDIVVAGNFVSPSITFETTTLTNAGIWWDIFLVRFDSLGNIIWAKSAGGNDHDAVFSLKIDPIGDIIIAGSFKSSAITFDINKLIKILGVYCCYENRTDRTNINVLQRS